MTDFVPVSVVIGCVGPDSFSDPGQAYDDDDDDDE